jgi:hypothetical protein
MSAMSKRNVVIAIGMILVLIIIGSRIQPRKQIEPTPSPTPHESQDVNTILETLSQEEFDELIGKLEALEFEDLEGLSDESYSEEEQGSLGNMSQEDFDALKKALEGFEFDDLGGL